MIISYTVVFLAILGIIFFIANAYRKGGRKLAEPHPAHIELLREFHTDELALAYNLTLANISLSSKFGSSNERILAEVEIARSLYVELMRRRKEPITVSQKAALKKQLAMLALLKTQERRTEGDYSDLTLRIDQDIDEPFNSENFFLALSKMLEALE